MSDSKCNLYDLDFEKRMENDELQKKNRTIKFGKIPNRSHVPLFTKACGIDQGARWFNSERPTSLRRNDRPGLSQLDYRA